MRLIILFMLMFFPIIGFANPDELPIQDFLAQVLLAVKEFGGLPWMAKISMIIMLLVGSMKVTFLRGLIWDRLGAAKAWVAPILALIAGILNMEVITLPGVLAYVGAGAGAIIRADPAPVAAAVASSAVVIPRPSPHASPAPLSESSARCSRAAP